MISPFRNIVIGLGRGGMVAKLNGSLLAKFLFLWTGSYDESGNLKSLINSDVITVTGKDFTGNYIPASSAATFSVPNTSDYFNADTDKFWTDGSSIKHKTVAQLVEFDYAKTFVKYSDSSPYDIQAIGILKSGETLTESEIDVLHKYFRLWIYWSGTLNANGIIKENRTIDAELEVSSAVIAQAYQNNVVITFNQNIDTNYVPDTSAFTIDDKIISNVTISGSNVTLTTSTVFEYGNIVVVDYTKPVSNYLRGTYGYTPKEASSFTDQAITNNITHPLAIEDGNTVGWYTPLDDNLVTKDGSDVTSILWDKIYGKTSLGAEESSGATIKFSVYIITATQSNHFYTGCNIGDVFVGNGIQTLDANNKVRKYNGHHLTQTVSGYCPIRQTGGLYFDGSDDYMRTDSFTFDQPKFYYMVVNQISWAANDSMVDAGYNTNAGRIINHTSTPNISVYAGSFTTDNTNLTLNTDHVLRVLVNGSSSKIIVDGTTATTGNSGTTNATGITLGGYGGVSASGGFAEIRIKECIFRNISDNATNETLIYNYLKAKYSL